jgi:hypothetical protein
MTERSLGGSVKSHRIADHIGGERLSYQMIGMANWRGRFLSGDQDNSLSWIGSPQNAEQFIAAHFRQAMIEKDQVKALDAAKFERLSRCGGGVRLMAVGLQQFDYDPANARFVVDNENSFWRLLCHRNQLSAKESTSVAQKQRGQLCGKFIDGFPDDVGRERLADHGISGTHGRKWFLAGNKHDTLFGIGPAEDSQKLVARHLGQEIVEEDQIKAPAAAKLNGVTWIAGCLDNMAVQSQQVRERSADAGLVVHDQNSL